MVMGSPAWAASVARSSVRSATRVVSRLMASGSSRMLRRARYCSSAWFFFRTASRLQLGVRLGERQHGRIARGDGLDLRVGELLAADVLGAADGALAGHHLGDEARLGLECLPHIGVERSFRDVAVDGDFLVVVPLAEDAALALLDLGRLPRGIEVMERDEASLHVRAGAHLLGGADQHADGAAPDPIEERLASWRRCRRRRWRRSPARGCRAATSLSVISS